MIKISDLPELESLDKNSPTYQNQLESGMLQLCDLNDSFLSEKQSEVIKLMSACESDLRCLPRLIVRSKLEYSSFRVGRQEIFPRLDFSLNLAGIHQRKEAQAIIGRLKTGMNRLEREYNRIKNAVQKRFLDFEEEIFSLTETKELAETRNPRRTYLFIGRGKDVHEAVYWPRTGHFRIEPSERVTPYMLYDDDSAREIGRKFRGTGYSAHRVLNPLTYPSPRALAIYTIEQMFGLKYSRERA